MHTVLFSHTAMRSGSFLPVQLSLRFHSVLNRIRCKHRSFCFWGKSSFLVPCGSPSQSTHSPTQPEKLTCGGKSGAMPRFRCAEKPELSGCSAARAQCLRPPARAQVLHGSHDATRHKGTTMNWWHTGIRQKTVVKFKRINSVFRVIQLIRDN